MRVKKISGGLAGLGLIVVAVALGAACSGTAVAPGDGDAASDSDATPTPTTSTTTTASTPTDGSAPPGDAASDTSAPDGATNDASDGSLLDGTSPIDAGPDAIVDAAPDSAPVGTPAVRFVGRWDTRLAAGPRVAFPGARIIARFDGTEVSVTMNNTTGFSGGPSRYDVFIDDVLDPAQLVTMTGVQTYPLANGLAAGVHKIELVKRTEGNLGVTTFMGFDFGAAGTLLPPPAAPTRKIEVISDSTIDGYGVDGMGPNCPAGTLEASHNSRLGLAGLVGSDLGADTIQVAYSGKGLYFNSYRPDTATMGVLYPRALPDDATSVWDFTKFVPDVVVISLGGSDYSPPSAAPLAQFTAKYDELVTQVRTYAPNAHVFMTIYAQIKESYPAGYAARSTVRSAIQAVIAAHPADTRLYLHEMTESVPAQETGCQYHGSPALHRALADTFVPVIKTRTGWL